MIFTPLLSLFLSNRPLIVAPASGDGAAPGAGHRRGRAAGRGDGLSVPLIADSPQLAREDLRHARAVPGAAATGDDTVLGHKGHRRVFRRRAGRQRHGVRP